jgi:rsbT co-antagonist protein RsbR
MESWFEKEQGPLIQCATATLRENAGLNRSALAPFRLPQIAQQLIAGLVSYAAGKTGEETTAIGFKMGQQGLSLGSLLAVGSRLLRELQQRQAGIDPIMTLQEYMSAVTRALVAGEGQDLRKQRDELQSALERSLRSREEELRRLIQELSTPIMPIHDGILALPLIGQIDDERANKITERLLDEIRARQARIIIIDVTGVSQMDRAVAAGLLRAARAVQLLGARVLLVGIRAEIARTVAQLDVDMSGLVTLANLRSGIEYALRTQGLTVQRLVPAAQPAQPARQRDQQNDRSIPGRPNRSPDKEKLA